MGRVFKFYILFVACTIAGDAGAADVARLTELFQRGYNSLYTPRMCGLNVERFALRAREENIDLSGAYVLRFVGGGFWETSGFYARGNPNQREMLGYFHFVLVAEGRVFDFDLARPCVLPLAEYIRLQFTPNLEPYDARRDRQDMRRGLPFWEIERIEIDQILAGSTKATWRGRLSDILSIDEVFKLRRGAGCIEVR